ncbi:MAG: MFS transporter [Spirochaetota bacterium]|jgi:EmrB/QacA subfamily drug resistance transporter|nr:MFS transporter [Spirochaetota bacterium]
MENNASEARSRTAILAAVIFGAFLTAFLGSALNIAIPGIAKEFSLSALTVSWVPTAYILCNAALILLASWLGDRYRRNTIYLIGLVITMISTLLAAFVTSGETLIAMRVVQGIGSSLIFANSTALITESQPAAARGRAIGLNVAATYLGLSAGPSIGGFLIQSYTWRSIFVIPFLCCVFAIIAALLIKNKDMRQTRAEKLPLDSAGAAYSIITPACFVLGVSYLDIQFVGLIVLALGVLFLALFIRHEKALLARNCKPLLNVTLFGKNRMFSFSCLASLLNYSSTFAVGFLLSIYLQHTMGLSPRDAGLIMITQPVIQAILSPVFGALSDRVESRILASIGMSLCALSVLWFALGGGAFLGTILIGLALAGLGQSLFASPNSNAIMSAVRPPEYGFASASIALARTLGQLFSMCLVGAIFALSFGGTEMAALPPDDLAQGMHLAFFLMVFCLVPGIWFSLIRNKNAVVEAL